MSYYNKSTNFSIKDSLTTGDPQKIVSGVEIDTEFNNISSGFSQVNSEFTNVDNDLDELKTIPQSSKGSAYTLQASDTGNHISISSGDVTVPTGVFSPGDIVVIYNNSTSERDVIAQSGVTMYWVNGQTGTRNLLQRALATILCVGSNTFVITGQGVT